MSEMQFDKDGNFEVEQWYVDYNKIKNSSNFTAVTRLTAASLLVNPYMTLGDFFTNLSAMDLEVLGNLVELAGNEAEENIYNNAMEEILLLSQMLSRAEGTETGDMDEVGKQVDYFMNMVAVTSLDRKGLIEVFYENMSFGSDVGDKPLARKRLEE